MKSKFYRKMKHLFMLGVVLFGCMAPLSVKAMPDVATKYLGGEDNYEHNGYYMMSEKFYLKNGSKWELGGIYKFSYDKHGNLLKRRELNSKGTLACEVSCDYKYDKRGNILSQKTLVDNKLTESQTYTYDKKGNIKTYKFYSWGDGTKWLRLSIKFTYKNGKLYKEKAYVGDSVCETIYRSDGTMKSSTFTDSSGSEQSKSTYDKYGNIIKSGMRTYKNTYKNGVLSSVTSEDLDTKSNVKRVFTVTYYTSGYRKGERKKGVTQYNEKVNGKWTEYRKDTTTYKYKADKTGKNVGEVTRYENGTPTTKVCYTWKKIKK